MKRMRSLQSFVSLVLLLIFPATIFATETQQSETQQPEARNFDPKQPVRPPAEDNALLQPLEQRIRPGMATTIPYGDALIEIGPDAVRQEVLLSFRELSAQQIAPMNTGMDNLTQGPRAAYRFLPHGTQFESDITVKLPYDPALIPAGLTENDIRTYYFDDQTGVWVPLELVQVDTANRKVVSRTNHFTDFVNGTLVVPEQPGPVTLTPTSLKDIQVANPAEGINLIEAPELNNRGSLDLSYPIDLPPGRNGLDPSLAISYDSGNDNGWMGVGWDLGISSVTVDTRWGVPRYDSAFETETYVVDGQHLAPVAHRNEVAVSRVADKVFTARIQGAFERIVRHGNDPDNYWWEVTDKSGVRRFYGGDPEAGTKIAEAVITDAQGHVFQWLLREIRDLNGNSIKYSYSEVNDSGIVNGINRYPNRIEYAVRDGLTDRYVVEFVRDRELPNYMARKDVSIDARGGFKLVTADLLKEIRVKFNDEMIRSYEMTYEEGPFEKTLLTEVRQYGENGTLFHTHEFDYFDEIRTPDPTGGFDYAGFDAAQAWNVPEDQVDIGIIPIDVPTGPEGQASAMSGAESYSIGGSVYLGFNPFSGTKDFSGGISLGFSGTNTKEKLALFDVNGDNLPDKVFFDGSNFAYRPNQSGPNGPLAFDPAQATTLGSLPALAEETAFTFAFGPEIYYVVSAGFTASFNWTSNPTYMADANGDGLVDFVSNGEVLFNRLDGSDVPTFQDGSGGTPVPISAGSVDATGLLDEEALNDLREQAIDESPLTDMVRRWVAPYPGVIDISGDVQLAAESSDGVRVAVQQNGAELWSTTIAGGDATPKTPSGVTGLPVAVGDRIYFRTQAVANGTEDVVSWNPHILYRDQSGLTTDVNLRDPYAFDAAADFTLAGRPGITVQMPFEGTVRIEGDFAKSATTTDDAIIEILRDGIVISNQSIAWDQTGTMSMGGDFDVLPDERIEARVRIDSPVDVTKFSWAPRLFYVASPDTSVTVTGPNGEFIIAQNMPVDMHLYPTTTLTAPQAAWVVPEDGSYAITPDASALPRTNVTFTVKKRGQLLSKQNLTLENDTSDAVGVDLELTAGDEIFFTYSMTDGNAVGQVRNRTTTVSKDGEDETLATSLFSFDPMPQDENDPSFSDMIYPQSFRGWSFFGYNGNRGFADLAIDESRLTLETTDLTVPPPPNPGPDDRTDDTVQPGFDPSTAGAFPFYPDPVNGQWRGTDENAWIAAGSAKPSRLGREELPAVPSLDDFAGGRAITRTSFDTGQAVTLGVSVLSGSVAFGQHRANVDYFDMNGDSFPDIVGDGRIHYTSMTGGLTPQNEAPANMTVGKVREGDTIGFTAGVGANPAIPKSNGKGKTDTDNKSTTKDNGWGTLKVNFGIGAGYGTSTVDYDFLDMNGDGLPDLVRDDGTNLWVRLNLGYSFAPQEDLWGAGAINNGESTNFNLALGGGYNKGTFDFAGGVNFDRTDSRAAMTLVDMNGDGLLDQVWSDATQLLFRLNTGAGFSSSAPIEWPTDVRSPFGQISDVLGVGSNAEVSVAKSTTIGTGAYFTIGIGPLCIAACYIIINPGFDFADSRARQEVALIDVNGDGYVDHLKSEDDSSLLVSNSPIGRTNLLREVRRPLGGSMTFDYERSGNTYEKPSSSWVLSRVELNDGQPGDGADVQLTTVRYENGIEDRLEREFYGYGRVTEEQRDSGNGEALYRQIVREYRTDSFYTQGLLTRMSVEDAGGNKWVETQNTWVLRQTAPTVIEPVMPDDLVATAPTASSETAVFPMLVRSDERFYMGAASPPKSTFTTITYDDLGNPVEFFDAVDVGSADDLQVMLGYADNCAGNYVVGVPNRVEVRDTNGVLLRKREADIDCTTGQMVRLRQFVDAVNFFVTDVEFDVYGNVSAVTGPPNQNGQRYRVDYEYDPVLQTYLTRSFDGFSLASVSTHDLKQGRVLSTVDDNGNALNFEYDEFGRAVRVVGPYEEGSGRATISFSYFDQARPPYAVTDHLDPYRDVADPITTVLFMDGIGRVVQTKKDGTVHAGIGSAPEDVMIVSGAAFFDFIGRTTSLYFPITEAVGTPGVYNGGVDGVNPTLFAYDLIDRTTDIALPSGLVQETEYGFDDDRDGILRFETIVQDVNGNRTHVYRDVTDLVTSVKEFLGNQEVWTSHGYNAMAELVSVTDDAGNVVASTYDLIGRRTAIQHPDTGLTEVVYDDASNVVAEINENLRAAGQQITFQYDYNRLTGVQFPQNPGNNITYFYGDAGSSFNRAGRVTMITDQAGSVEYFYGLLGEVNREIRTFASDTQGNNQAEVYTTQYTYDTWGRLQELVYPDGELVEYDYDSGGRVSAVNGFKGGWSYEYLRNMEYDKFSQPAYMVLGNGVQTSYGYDPVRRRLTNLVAGLDLANPFQNVSLSYDPVGNVLQSRNDVPVPAANEFGGLVTQDFEYDSLYRMTASSGEHRFAPNKRRTYSVDMVYDTVNNILSKSQLDQVVNGNRTRGLVQRGTTYDWAYQYGGAHTPSQIGDRAFTYDRNGNQSGWDNLNNGTRRTLVWDENNNVQSIFDNGHEKTFKYDHKGQRVMKRGPQGETVYVNQYFNIRNREIGTKHFFVGSQRIAAKLMKKSTGGGGRPPFEKDRYFYHPDHVGSSRYITDADGELFQHLQYFPFGEIWIEESTNTQRTPYLFAGHELDEETGLSYFGDRFYEARTSLWLNADPAMNEYLEGFHNGGVYNPRNLGVYSFAFQNPMKYTDLDGRTVDTAWDAFEIGLGITDAIDNAQQGSFFSAALNAAGVGVDAIDTGSGFIAGESVTPWSTIEAAKKRDQRVAGALLAEAAAKLKNERNRNGGSQSDVSSDRDAIGANPLRRARRNVNNPFTSSDLRQASRSIPLGDDGLEVGDPGTRVPPRNVSVLIAKGGMANARSVFSELVGRTRPLSEFDTAAGAEAMVNGKMIVLRPGSWGPFGVPTIEITDQDGRKQRIQFEP